MSLTQMLQAVVKAGAIACGVYPGATRYPLVWCVCYTRGALRVPVAGDGFRSWHLLYEPRGEALLLSFYPGISHLRY